MIYPVQKWDRSTEASSPGCLFGGRDDLNGVSEPNFTLCEDPRVDAAPSGVEFLRNANEFAVNERRLDRFAGIREGSDLEEYLVTQPESRSWNDQIPVDSLDREVLAGGPDVDWVAFLLEGKDPFEGIHADGSFGSAMVFCIVLSVPKKP